MEKYHSSPPASTQKRESRTPISERLSSWKKPPSLVTTHISQRKYELLGFQRYKRSVRIIREKRREAMRKGGGKKGAIHALSAGSQKRLKFTAGNADLISSFCLTYHKAKPSGRESKEHLNAFLRALKYRHPEAGYLWVLEFQRRGAPHYHLFLSLPVNRKLGQWMADRWHKVAEPESPFHLKWHRNKKNFFDWDMGSGSYVCKYIEKQDQKKVPKSFKGVGRFWGASRGLVPDPEEITVGMLDREHGAGSAKLIERQLHRYQEQLRKRCDERKKKKKIMQRSAPGCYLIQSGAEPFAKIEKFLSKNAPF